MAAGHAYLGEGRKASRKLRLHPRHGREERLPQGPPAEERRCMQPPVLTARCKAGWRGACFPFQQPGHQQGVAERRRLWEDTEKPDRARWPGVLRLHRVSKGTLHKPGPPPATAT